MSCVIEGAKVHDLSCLIYNANEGAHIQVKHAWVHLLAHGTQLEAKSWGWLVE